MIGRYFIHFSKERMTFKGVIKAFNGKKNFLLLFCFLLLSGCSSFRSHNQLMTPVIATRNNHGAHDALTMFYREIPESQRDELLYALELGTLLQENQRYHESIAQLEIADAQITAWEQTTILDPTKLLSYLGASTLNEQMKPYEGQDYEKTWLLTLQALNYLALNDWESARVTIKRTHEREEIIAAFRAQELAAIRTQARTNDWVSSDELLGNYPFEYIQSNEVLDLQNSYQNAFSHYLAGFIYEALNEPGLAAPGYRKALELNPDSKILRQGLGSLDERMHYSHSSQAAYTDVLFIIERGDAPIRSSFNVTIPFYYTVQDNNGGQQIRSIFIPVAFPVIKPAPALHSMNLKVGSHRLTATPVMDLNVMARRALHDEMTGLIARTLARATFKGSLQYMANDIDPLLGAFANVFSVVTENTDDRLWRTLPGGILLARDYLPEGDYPLTLDRQPTGQSVQIQGRYAIVIIRASGSGILVHPVATHGQLAQDPQTTQTTRPSFRSEATAPEITDYEQANTPHESRRENSSRSNRRNSGRQPYRHGINR